MTYAIQLQITNPNNAYQIHERTVSWGDHSFTATVDGKYVYCFSNENWSANSKEVSFNVHGIVYVPESEAPTDPLEKEGTSWHSSNAPLGYSANKLLQSATLPI